ncbi:hypothetical protein [Nocardia nova]|uniref:hypothetical protein n=1 Tax=Nocardia nova TaxID=37330 RepID=UPI0018941622|nr:hypothetical protein [Nocardia nova]MBF6145960.1 hypothetical protein [Nocardia nova]MDN2500279.1 MFS transporter [Nocardia nova]
MTKPDADRSSAIVGVLAFAGIIASVMQTLVIPLIAQFPQLLHTTPSNTSWIVTSTLLVAALASAIPVRRPNAPATAAEVAEPVRARA